MRAVVEGDLGSGDVADPQRLERLRHLHGAVQPIVIGESERAVTLLGGGPGELNRV